MEESRPHFPGEGTDCALRTQQGEDLNLGPPDTGAKDLRERDPWRWPPGAYVEVQRHA